MNLKEILSISGKTGLYKLVSRNKNGIIVESLIDKKRFPAFGVDKVSALGDISIFAVDRDIPLKDVMKLIYEKENGGMAIDHKADPKLLKTYMEEVLPDYDSERVYVSDMKKLFYWYNILVQENMLDFTEEETETTDNVVDESTEK